MRAFDDLNGSTREYWIKSRGDFLSCGCGCCDRLAFLTKIAQESINGALGGSGAILMTASKPMENTQPKQVEIGSAEHVPLYHL
jgi:hypothetical protein